MIKLYGLGTRVGESGWVPIEIEDMLIIEIDKREIKKYTLESVSTVEGTYITFYMKDGTIDNTNNKIWSGPASEYENYFKKELGISSTPYSEWRTIWGYKWVNAAPNGYWVKNYKSIESFSLNPKLVDKVYLSQEQKNVSIKIKYIDGTIEEHWQSSGTVKDYKDQFEFDLKIENVDIIIE